MRLLRAYFEKDAEAISAAPSQIEGVLGIFQKLVANKAHDHEGINLVCALLEFVPIDRIAQYVPAIFSILLQRMSTSKTAKVSLQQSTLI